jgi:hypothetical protein
MKQIISFLTVVILLTFSSSFGQSTYEFLRVDLSARAAALGGSFVSKILQEHNSLKIHPYLFPS